MDLDPRSNMPQPVSAEHKSIAKYLAHAFGRDQFRVVEMVHNTLPLTIDILWCKDAPGEGVTAYGTVGLSDYDLLLNGRSYPVRVELVGANASTEDNRFGLVLGSAAFTAIRSQQLVYPGVVMSNIVRTYFPASTTPHLFFTAPFLWEERLKCLELDTRKVAWLLSVPISEAESSFLHQHGPDALETLFERNNIDIFDLSRPSIF
jgi:hypothetical protein